MLRRWGKLLIACLLTVSLAIMPVMGTNAQKGSTTKTSVQKQHRSTQEQMKQRAMTRLKQMKAHGILRLPSVAALGQKGMKLGKQGTAQSTEPSVVEFKGQATMYDIHYFYFSLSRQSDIEVIDVAGQEVPYYLVNADTLRYVTDTHDMPAGNYYLITFGLVGASQPYHFKLSGEGLIPENSYPEQAHFTTRFPFGDAHYTRLNQGEEDQVHTLIARAEDGAGYVYLNDRPVGDKKTGDFTIQTTFRLGYNTLTYDVFRNGSRNWISTNYEVIGTDLIRLDGADRFEVSANISREIDKRYADPQTVYIASGLTYPDALSGAPLATRMEAPLLLTQPDHLPDKVKAEIERLKPKHAVILGGTGSVSTQVRGELAKMGIVAERISGADRFEVSANTADRLVRMQPTDTAVIASGTVFSDALSVSVPAGLNGYPLLLVKRDAIPEAINKFLQAHPEIRRFIIAGGPATVDDRVMAELDKRGEVDRIYGVDRYDVSVNVVRYFGMYTDSAALARGDVFTDALSGAPLAAMSGTPLFLTPSDRLHSYVEAHLSEVRSQIGPLNSVYLFGGTGSISTAIEKRMQWYLGY